MRSFRKTDWLIAAMGVLVACGGAEPPSTDAAVPPGRAVAEDAGTDTLPEDSGMTAQPDSGQPVKDAGQTRQPDSGQQADAGQMSAGPTIDTTSPQLFRFAFTAKQADSAAAQQLGSQQAYFDSRAKTQNVLVIHLHGAGAPSTCGSAEHGQLLAGFGFHVFMPCYASNYGIDNCKPEFDRCRLEAFDGVDRTPVIDIAKPDSIEARIVAGLAKLAKDNPQADWG